ncbi:MAG: hypothetical protein ACLU99_01090 [Alphaproteobacteria bacterium]
MLFTKELEKNNFICSSCDHHLRLPLNKRFEMLFDNGDYKCNHFAQTSGRSA